jgi:hypothetical protein
VPQIVYRAKLLFPEFEKVENILRLTKKLFFGPIPLFFLFNTQTMHIKSTTQQHCYVFPKKPYTVAGFEPGSAVSEADAMSTAPRRQGNIYVF